MKIVPTMIQCPSPQGAGYSEEWTIKLKPGYVYHVLELETNLQKAATIKRITFDIGGVPVATAEGAVLDMLDKAYGKHQATGRVVLDLAKFEFRSQLGVYQTSIPTALSDDITLKIEFGVKDAADPATPTLKAKAWVSDNPAKAVIGGGRKFVPIRTKYTLDSAAAGDLDWAFPTGNQNRFVQRLLMDESNVSISKVKVYRGDRLIREMTRKDIDYALQRYAGVTLQAGWLIFDFTVMGFGSNDAISTEGLNFTFETDSNGAVNTYVEGFERIAA